MIVQFARASSRIVTRRFFGRPSAIASIDEQLPIRRALATLPPVSRYLVIGLCSSVGLVILVVIISISVLELSVMKSPAWFDADAPQAATVGNRTINAYDQVVVRPLFARNRAGPARVENTPAPASQSTAPLTLTTLDTNIVLKGVLISGSLEKAFMTSAQNPTGRWVQVTGEIDGWRLVEVRPEQVVMKGQGQTLSLKRSVVAK